ncbi:avidin-like [Leptosomus discolor]
MTMVNRQSPLLRESWSLGEHNAADAPALPKTQQRPGLAKTPTKLLCQAVEIPRGERAGVKEAKGTKNKWRPGREQERPTGKAKQCYLTGWWENELGSSMHVSAVDSQGNFSGEYHTAVSSAQKPIVPSPLVGSQHLDNEGQCTFGFPVNWKFSDSTAVFVGQCFAGDGGEEVLQTSWLLREKVDSLPSHWEATR